MLRGRKIIVGVTSSIAAYKVAILVRLLIKEKAEIQVLMTPSATQFITPLTLSTLSKHPVLVDFVKDKTGLWNNHVDLGLWADAFIIAPASANTLAKCTHGICDNLLLATYLSAKCPVFFAPAMDLDMYQHPSTAYNLEKIESYGNFIIPAESGELASGLVGQGRMAEPEHIVRFIQDYFTIKKRFENKSILITAGPTQEALDPVRYLTNHSSGKMGYAIAEAFANEGAKVELVSGITNLKLSHHNINLHIVRSAQDMYEAAEKHFAKAEIIILAAAVADYTPAQKSNQKIKKKEGETKLTISLKRTIDIAEHFGKHKKNKQILVGFAMETENEEANAQKKIEKKNLDLIVLNSLNEEGVGFQHDTNRVTFIFKNGLYKKTDLKSKTAIAQDILEEVAGLVHF